jgi:membrane associated rhomboid family serine protease
MPKCLKCGAELPVDEEGYAPVLCDRCAGRATRRARVGMSTGTFREYPATTVLLAINLAVFAGMVLTGGSPLGFSGETLVRWGGNFGPWTLSGQYWRLLTATFVHGSIIHLLFNMWCLWSLGQLAEKLFGSWITAAVYLLTGVGGSMLSLWWDPGRLSVGASGAIFGIAGAVLAGIKFGHVSVSSWQRRSIFSSLMFFVVANFAIGLGPGIDNMNHLGGFVAGLIFGVPLATASASGKKSYEWATIALAAAVLAGVGTQMVKAYRPSDSPVSAALMAMQQEDYPRAVKLLEQIAQKNPQSANAYALLGRAYQLNHQRDQAIAAYEHAIQLDPNLTKVRDQLEQLRSSSQ